MRKPIPSDKTRDVLEFATKRPRDRLESITNGLQVTLFVSATPKSLNIRHRRFCSMANPNMSASLG